MKIKCFICGKKDKKEKMNQITSLEHGYTYDFHDSCIKSMLNGKNYESARRATMIVEMIEAIKKKIKRSKMLIESDYKLKEEEEEGIKENEKYIKE